MSIIHLFRLYIVLLLLSVSGFQTAKAQLLPNLTDTGAKVEVIIPDDSLGRDNPRGTVNGFIKAVADQKYIRASQYLNLDIPKRSVQERERIVKVLQQLLDRGGNIMANSLLSNKKTGKIDDELPPEEDLVGTVTHNSEVINLFVEQTGDAAAPIWKFSSTTVKAVAEVTIDKEALIDEVLPGALKNRMWGGVPAGHWLAILFLFVASYLAARVIIWALAYALKLVWIKARSEKGLALLQAFSVPFRLYLAVWLFIFISQHVGISIIVRQKFSTITLVVGIVAFILLLLRLTDIVSSISKGKLSSRGRVSAVSIILFLRRTIKVAIIVFGVIGILSTLGLDVTTGLAALGIGGIALALGAQKTVENFVGSVTLVIDQPVRVGDYCKVGDIAGTVEQIGMRSTQIRTGERSVVTIPNGDFSSNRIENFAHRDRFLFSPVLRVHSDTAPAEMKSLLVNLRKIMQDHPMVIQPARVRFVSYATDALNIEIYSYIKTANQDKFLEVKEELLLSLMEAVEEDGLKFAFPSPTYILSENDTKAISKNTRGD